MTNRSITASAFSDGHSILFGVGGLLISILGTTLILLPKRKKEDAEA